MQSTYPLFFFFQKSKLCMTTFWNKWQLLSMYMNGSHSKKQPSSHILEWTSLICTCWELGTTITVVHSNLHVQICIYFCALLPLTISTMSQQILHKVPTIKSFLFAKCRKDYGSLAWPSHSAQWKQGFHIFFAISYQIHTALFWAKQKENTCEIKLQQRAQMLEEKTMLKCKQPRQEHKRLRHEKNA